MYFGGWGLTRALVTNIYINKSTGILIIIYIDDMLIIGKDKAKIKALKRSLTRRFEIEDLGPTKYFIGVRIT